jgi:hypothetical protein
MLTSLTKKERLLLLKFVCAFAWTDLKVQRRESEFVRRLIDRLELDPEDAERALEWLKLPPAPEEIDPESVPKKHRALFLQFAREVIEVDGKIDPNEAELYETLEQLLAN